MKDFLKLLIALGILLAAFSYYQPRTYQVRRSKLIYSSNSNVFALISDLKKWERWSPWYQKDPDMLITYSGATTDEVGCFAEWSSSSEGKGKKIISDIEENRVLKIELEFYEPFENKAKLQFFLEDLSNEQTELTWVFHGKNDTLLSKLIYLVMKVEESIGRDYEVGLENIKTIAESETIGKQNESEAENFGNSISE